MSEITYKGPHEYAGVICRDALKNIKPEHRNYQTAPSNLYTFGDGVTICWRAYHTPKSGIKIMAWITDDD